MKRYLVGIGLVAAAVALIGAFGDSSTPDADHQEKTATACLRGAGLDVKSDIPPYYRGGTSPQYRLDIDARGGEQDHLAFVYLFDDSASAELYLERVKSYAEDEALPAGVKIEQRGPAIVRLLGDPPQAAAIRGCVDRAAKPPPGKK